MARFLLRSLVVFGLFTQYSCQKRVELSEFGEISGDDHKQLRRFKVWMKPLKEKFKKAKNPKEAARALLKDDARIIIFYLQALGKLYEPDNKKFSKFRRDFKELEDLVGAFKMSEEVGDGEEAEKAAKKLVKKLEDEKWVTEKYRDSRLKQWEDFLEGYEWKKSKKDFRDRIEVLLAQLRNISGRPYDFAYLEDEQGPDGIIHGLHELRRELRWFLIESRALNGMVQFKAESEGCPLQAFESLLTDYKESDKYTGLPDEEPYHSACKISRCLFLGVNKNVSILGALKDEAEKIPEARRTNRVPAHLAYAAQQAAQEIEKSGLIATLESEIGSCIEEGN